MTVKIQYKLYSRKLKKRRENEESLNTTATQQKEKEAESRLYGGNELGAESRISMLLTKIKRSRIKKILESKSFSV